MLSSKHRSLMRKRWILLCCSWACSGFCVQAAKNVTSNQPQTTKPNKTAGPSVRRPTTLPWSANTTNQPQPRPSAAPSQAPSTLAPTLSCHDDATYLSPINSLTCSDHRGTNCLLWRHLGLNATEVERLVDACPVSCNIACGSLVPFEIRVSFLIEHAANYLSPESDAILEEVGIEYLTNYARSHYPESELDIYEGILLSQQMLSQKESQPATSHSDTINNQTIVNLIVSVEFRGYGINVSAENATIVIVEGLDSPGYTKAIQRSGDQELVDVEITTNLERGLLNDTSIVVEEQNPPKGNGSTIAAIAIIAALFAGAGFVGVVWYRRLGHFPVHPGSDRMHQDSSDRIDQSISQNMPLSPAISFESCAQRVPSQNNQGLEVAQINSFDHENQDDYQKGTSGSVASTEIDELEHPFTGIIPPMIVIDNLEGEDETVTSKVRSVVPSKRVQASVAFLSALRNRAMDPTSNLQDLYHDVTEEALPAKKRPRFRKGRFLRPPVTTTKVTTNVQSKDGKVDAKILNLRVDIDDRLHSTYSDIASSLDNESPLSRRSRSPKDSKTSTTSPITSPKADTDSNQRRGRTLSDASTVQAGPETPIEETKVEDPKTTGNAEEAVSESEPAISSSWARGSLRKGAGRLTPSDDESRRTHSRHRRLGSRSSSDSGSNVEPGEGEVEIVLQAPRTGKLGLIIQCMEGVGPVVVHVKDYSPLLGQVQPGDRLVNIDGIRTTNMTLSEVTSMLPGRQMSRWATPVRLIVIRTCMGDPAAGDLQQASFSYESSSDNHSPLMLSLSTESNTPSTGARFRQSS